MKISWTSIQTRTVALNEPRHLTCQHVLPAQWFRVVPFIRAPTLRHLSVSWKLQRQALHNVHLESRFGGHLHLALSAIAIDLRLSPKSGGIPSPTTFEPKSTSAKRRGGERHLRVRVAGWQGRALIPCWARVGLPVPRAHPRRRAFCRGQPREGWRRARSPGLAQLATQSGVWSGTWASTSGRPQSAAVAGLPLSAANASVGARPFRSRRAGCLPVFAGGGGWQSPRSPELLPFDGLQPGGEPMGIVHERHRRSTQVTPDFCELRQ